MRQVDHYVNETGSGNTPRSFTYVYSYNTDHTLSRVSINSIARRSSVVYSYDAYDRISTKTYDYSSFDIQSLYTYDDISTGLSGRVKTHTVAVDGNTTTYTYTYDSNGNITWISSGDKDVRYVYDDLNRLIREDNGFTEKTYIYEYDAAGNILDHDVYRYTLSTPSFRQKLSGIDITYYTGPWGDIATSINGHTITYDLIGNPLSYYNGQSYTFSWVGRQLNTAFVGSNRFDFTYDDAGIRTAKVKSGVITNYHYDGSLLVAEETDGNITVYIYDAEGSPIGMQYHGASYASGVWDCYWYEKNLFGDIVAVYNNSGTKLVLYVYDAWGAATVTYSNGGESTTATSNPFRYRGYYYDIDLSLYRTGTRYYDAVVGRFISPDIPEVTTATPMSLTDKNLFAYCDNNPVMRVDHGGKLWGSTLLIMGIGGIVGAVIGAVTSIITQEISGEDINWKSVAVSVASGFVSGAVAASPLGVVGQTITGGIIGGTTEIFNSVVKQEEIRWDSVIVATAIGAGAGWLGGNGANHKNLMSHSIKHAKEVVIRESRRTNQKYATKAISQAIYARNNTLVSSGIGTGISYFAHGIGTSIISSIYSKTISYFRR